MKEILTKERALELHRQMWTDMQTELGDCPSGWGRLKFKKNWCMENGYTVMCNCFLCEYIRQHPGLYCDDCLIDWSKAENISDLYDCREYTCKSEYGDNEADDYYCVAPISSILAIPERKE